ncbi:aryl-alcohol dehydrogenase-like predicted oxidoreductase [Streptomyces sp. 3330]|nr:aryl-alcohol dehydrogenase-like predicted oxidoreductase [Streptomyces sp. 3330]
MPLSIEGRPDPARALAAVHAALDAGGTLLDTADSSPLPGAEPGHDERLVARALAAYGGDTSGVQDLLPAEEELTRLDGTLQ